MKRLLIFCIVLLSLFTVYAQEEVQEENIAEINITEQPYEKQTKDIIDFQVIGVSPKTVKLGDVVFDIKVENTGNVDITDVVPIIIGRGFSTYDVSTISVLRPGQKSYMHVAGKFTEPGPVILTIKIKDRLFYETINVEFPVVTSNKSKEDEVKKQEFLNNLSQQLSEIKKGFDLLEKEMLAKKNDYDLSTVSLSDLKNYIRNTESAILSGDAQKANISVTLAINEYNDQKRNLELAPKKPLIMRLRENALIISAIAGSIITVFTLFELIKKKQEGLYKKIKEIKLHDDTKLIIKKKKQKKPKKKKSDGDSEEDI